MRHLDVLHLVHAVMSVFALVSVQNIATFFVSAGHSPGAAWTLGIALGLALVTISVMLTQIDQGQDKATLWWLLVSGSVLALVSGSIQAAEYAKHLEPWAAMGLGYGLPVGGEVLLAFATSSYVVAKKRQKIRMATAGTTARIAECVAEALSDVDVSKVRKYVERRIDQIVRAQVDVVAQELMPTTPVAAAWSDPVPVPAAHDEDHGNRQFGPQNMPKAQRKRHTQIVTNIAAQKQAILRFLDTNGPTNITALAAAIQAHRETTRKYLLDLAAAGQVETVKRKWQIIPASGER